MELEFLSSHLATQGARRIPWAEAASAEKGVNWLTEQKRLPLATNVQKILRINK